MKITTFGSNPHTWNTGTREGDDDSGYPGIAVFGNAVSVWALAQDRKVTVEEVALAFNVDPGLILLAIDDHPWMFVGPYDVIEQDGE